MKKLFSSKTSILLLSSFLLLFSSHKAFALFEDADARRAILEIREKLKEYNLYGLAASKSKNPEKISDQLEKLNSLFKSGAISEAEFKKAKNRILNN